MNDYKATVLEGLMSKAQTDRLESKASLSILLDFPAGIGDHSTSDLHNNLNEALSSLADAEDRIETLKRNYPDFYKCYHFPTSANQNPPF